MYFHASNYYKIHQINDSDIFQWKIGIPDKNNLFATMGSIRLDKDFFETTLHNYHTTNSKTYSKLIQRLLEKDFKQ